jgi:hypothetical protein
LRLNPIHMARFSRVSFLLVHLLFSSILSAQPAEEIDWRYEIDLLGKELVRRHSDLFFQADSAAFFRELDRIATEAHGQSVFRVAVRLQQALAGLGDPQTRINYHFLIEDQYILPIECYWFDDGLYILKCPADHRELAGKRIISLNGFPLGQVIDSLSTLLAYGNPSLLKGPVPRMITWTQLLDYFGFADTLQVELGVEDPRGFRTSRRIMLPERSGELLSAYPETLPLGWQDKKTYFREYYFPGEEICYIQYNKCWSREAEIKLGTGARALFMPSFTEFEKRVFRTMKDQHVGKLVMDLRFNDGGDPSQGTRFIEKLANSSVMENGQVYLVVGRKTCCSALVNAVDLMRRFDVVIIGEETGGKPNHFGDVERFVLPESKLVVNCATRRYDLLEGDPPSLLPDIITPETFTSFMEGIDPAFEAIRNHQGARR